MSIHYDHGRGRRGSVGAIGLQCPLSLKSHSKQTREEQRRHDLNDRSTRMHMVEQRLRLASHSARGVLVPANEQSTGHTIAIPPLRAIREIAFHLGATKRIMPSAKHLPSAPTCTPSPTSKYHQPRNFNTTQVLTPAACPSNPNRAMRAPSQQRRSLTTPHLPREVTNPRTSPHQS